jgi:probable biosynthetic protein (TIGR04099 family)
MSEQSISVDGRVLGKLRMISVFLRRGQAGRNRSVERAMLRQMPPFRGLPEPRGFAATTYAFRTDAWEAFDGFRRLDRRVLRSFAIDPCPQADFNGADLLYFASLQSFVDRAEWAWFRYADPVAVTRQRHLFFYGNIELGDTLDIRLCGVTRGSRHCAHWCEIIRQSDGARIADVMTERLLAG